MLFTPIKLFLTMGTQEFDLNENLVYETKYDGWQILLHQDGDPYTRNGYKVMVKIAW